MGHLTSEFTIICYTSQENLPTTSQLRKELLKAAKYSNLAQSNVTAADFYSINRTTLGSTITAIVTYLIVLGQFDANMIQVK